MAMEWMDNFGIYGGNIALLENGLYAQAQSVGTFSGPPNALVTDPDPNDTGEVFRVGTANGTSGFSGNANTLRRVFSTPLSVAGVGLRLWLPALPNSNVNHAVFPFSFRDSANNMLCVVEVDPSGRLIVWRGTIADNSITRTTILAQTTNPVIVANAWQHIECRVGFNSGTGSVQIRVEGVEVLNVSNINTDPTNAGCLNWAAFNWCANNPSGISNRPPHQHIKDLFGWNTSGTRNNSFVGTIAVFPILPNSDVALNWTPTGAANGWSILDNIPPNDSAYIAAGNSPIPAAYEAGMTDLPADVTSVRAVMSIVRARKTDGGDGNLQVSAVSGASVAAGANRPISTAFTYWTDMFEEDPATSAPWSRAGVNAMNLRANRTV